MVKGTTRISFDTEFTGLYQGTKLVSIGLIADVPDCSHDIQFYAELTDWDKNSCYAKDKWFQENVVNNLVMNQENPTYIDNYHIGTKHDIRLALEHWLSQFEDVQLVSDVCHYDMMLFVSLWEMRSAFLLTCRRCVMISTKILQEF